MFLAFILLSVGKNSLKQSKNKVTMIAQKLGELWRAGGPEVKAPLGGQGAACFPPSSGNASLETAQPAGNSEQMCTK